MALTREYREVIVMRYFGELSYGEIAEVIGIPEKTVKSRLLSARQRLGEILQGQERELVNEQDREDFVDEALDRLGRTAPPADLVDSVMAEVSAAESQMTAWRRWRRALQGRRLTNFVAGARVSSSQRRVRTVRRPWRGRREKRDSLGRTGFAAAALVSCLS